MADVVGNMHVRLGMDMKEFISKKKQYDRGLTSMGKKASMLGGKLKAAFAGAFAGITVVGALRSVTKELDRMNKVAKMSDQIGISTEAMAALQHAADQMTVSGEKLSAGLQTMAKRLGEAARGIGAARPALETLGLSADDLVKMDADRAFLKIADAISRVEDPMQRTALAANIFSKGNQELVQMMAKGAGEIERYRKEAEDLGLVFSREEGAKAEAYVDAVDRMNKAWRGLAVDVAPMVADALMEIAAALEGIGVLAQKATSAMDGLGGKWKEFVNARTPGEAGGTVGSVHDVGKEMEDSIISKLHPNMKRGGGAFGRLMQDLKKSTVSLGKSFIRAVPATPKSTGAGVFGEIGNQLKIGLGGAAKDFAAEMADKWPMMQAGMNAWMDSSYDKPPTDETFRQASGIAAAERGSAAAHSLIAGAMDPQIKEIRVGNKILREIATNTADAVIEVAVGPVP